MSLPPVGDCVRTYFSSSLALCLPCLMAHRLALGASWILLGGYLWGSSSTAFTNLLMPGIVGLLKFKADRAVQNVTELAPDLEATVGSLNNRACRAVRALAQPDASRNSLSQLGLFNETSFGSKLPKASPSIMASTGSEEQDDVDDETCPSPKLQPQATTAVEETIYVL